MRLSLLSILFAIIVLSCSTDEGEPALFSIDGRVTENGQGVAGVQLSVDGRETVTTDADGRYELHGIPAGDYTITPQEPGRTFSPGELHVSLTNENKSDQDFIRNSLNGLVHRGQSWELFNSSAYALKQNTPTLLQLDLAQNALWYHASRGGLVYRTITGDFTITATVNAVSKSNNSQSASCNVCLGGLMVRNPAGNSENYVHLVTGNTPNGPGYEHKTTVNNVSTYTAVGNGQTRHDLRIQRSGHNIVLSQKAPGAADWEVITTYVRHDFPSTMMVGLNIYTAAGGAVADLSVIYENVSVE